jgi:hypothetical protein
MSAVTRTVSKALAAIALGRAKGFEWFDGDVKIEKIIEEENVFGVRSVVDMYKT